MSINLSALMKQRYDTAVNWTAQNPTLLAGEIGIESDTKKWKVGTGATAWTSLAYAIGGTYPIVNADIAAAAAIAYSKLATLTSGNIVLGSAANVATSTAVTGDVTISNAGVTSIASGVIVNADISASAAIAGSKIVAATTGVVGAVQLSDSTSTTSSTLASTPTAVKSAYDLANAALPKAGGTMTGALIATAGTVTANGIQVGTGTTYAPGIYSPGTDQLSLTTNGVDRLRFDANGYAQSAVNGLGVGRVPAMQYYRLNAANAAGATTTAVQSLLGVGVTLVGSTVYEFEGYFVLTRSGGTTQDIAISFGGTATVNNARYAVITATGVSSTLLTPVFNDRSGVGAIAVINNARDLAYMLIKGTISINAGGTFIPQYNWVLATTVAMAAQAGSYFRIFPLGASGANTSIGTWA